MDDYFNLGNYSLPVSTSSKEAQIWFDRGLNWIYGFNHEESITCFNKALEYDPDLAMAHWGIAYGSGPFYNLPWRHLNDQEADKYTKICHDHIQIAISLIPHASEFETDLIYGLSARYPKPHRVSEQEFDQWDDAYAHAMQKVYQKYPENVDVMAIFSEAMMTRTPWKLWDIKTGMPAENSDVIESIDVLEKGKSINPTHPAILHLHIHATEMSPTPEDALTSANVLGTLCPDAGHMNHMPGHTYVLCGLYEEAKIASEKAIRADNIYLDYAGPFNFYTTSRCHDLHLMMYACMFLGQFEPAITAAYDIRDTLNEEVLGVKGRPQLATTMEGYYSMIMHVLVRFGKWQEIIDTPMPPNPDLYCVSTPMHHYAKGIAHATLGQLDDAEQERDAFRKAFKRVPSEQKFFNNWATDILAVGEKMLDGELEYHKGNYEEAFDHLRESIYRGDNLAYTEPWAWMHPPRHALGALLMEQGQYVEAEQVYRTDLGLNDDLPRCLQHHDNIWSMHGLAECLNHRDEKEEIKTVEKKLSIAMAKTDLPITSSCACRKKSVPAKCCKSS